MDHINRNTAPILAVNNLHVSFKTDDGLVHAVRGVSFDLYKGETLCIVGESGSGKSVTSKTIMGILSANAVIENGSVMYEGEDLTKVDESEFHRIRGHKIGMVFQDPLSSLNPIMRVGKQITEAMLINSDLMKRKYDALISKEEAALKNNEAKKKAAYQRAERMIENSDEKFEKEIYALTREIDEAIFEKDEAELKNDAEKIAACNEKIKRLQQEKPGKVQALKKQKAEEHKRLAQEAKQIKAQADAEYKKNKPALLENLKKRKVEAKTEIEAYKIEQKALFDKDMAALQHELENAKNDGNKTAEIQKKMEIRKQQYQALFKISKQQAKATALKVMAEVGIPQPEVRYNQYPFEFSGGMRQRIVIAIALTANPEVLICDEPTTALDVTIQAQILELINKLKAERNMSIIFITHDLGVVANMADRVAVMYAGKIVEVGTDEEIFYDPKHPYTWALLSSIPDIDSHEKLEAIPGTPPYLLNPPKGDAFAARNKYAMAIDFQQEPPYFKITDTHFAATWLLDKRAPQTEKPRIVSQRIKASIAKAKIETHREELAKGLVDGLLEERKEDTEHE